MCEFSECIFVNVYFQELSYGPGDDDGDDGNNNEDEDDDSISYIAPR